MKPGAHTSVHGSSVKQTDKNYPHPHPQSISVANPANASTRSGTNGGLRKKMKPYKSTQTRRMPDNNAAPVKYSTNPQDNGPKNI